MIEIMVNGNTGHTEYYYSVSDVCKMLGLRDASGKLIGRNNMFKVLRYAGVLCQDNTPKQHFLNMGLAIYHRTIKRYKTYGLPMFSERGVNYLQRQFECGNYQVFYEPTQKKKITVNINDVC
jgi:hypothetical protein